MSRRWILPFALAAGLSLAPRAAEAVTLRLGVGANYWFTQQAYFDGIIGLELSLLPILSVGGRGGLLLTTGPARAGFPIDLLVRLMPLPSFYIEGLAGPWLLINTGQLLHVHAAIGAGITVGPISFGPEVGYLDPDAIIGARLAFRF